MSMNYASGRITAVPEDEFFIKISMGARMLGYYNRIDKTFRCFRDKRKCDTDSCRECKHPCHYFKLFAGFGFNYEALLWLRQHNCEGIFIILTDTTSGQIEKRLLSIDKDHWAFSDSDEFLRQRIVKMQGFESQIIVPEADFKQK